MTDLEIEAFLGIVRTGSLTAAAQQLYVSQPALSMRLSTLEQEVGTPLFRRQKGARAVRLTEAGRAFIPIAEKWCSLWADTRRLSQLPTAPPLTLAAVGSVATYLLPRPLQQILEQNPPVRLYVTEQHSRTAYPLVASGEVMLALVNEEQHAVGVETTPFFQCPMRLVGRGVGDVSRPQELDPTRELLLPWNDGFRQWHSYWFGGEAIPLAVVDTMALLEVFLRQENIWACVPSFVADNLTDVPSRPLENAPPPIPHFWLSRVGQRAEGERRLTELLREELTRYKGIELFV